MTEKASDSKQILSKTNQAKIKQANNRLKAGGVKVSLVVLGKSLYLHATLPPKPGSNRADYHQQRIALGWGVNPKNIELAEKEARKIGALNDLKQFDWQPYLKIKIKAPESCSDWISQFERVYRNTMEPVTWRTDYHNIFSRLPPNEPLTEIVIKNVLEKIEPNTRNRKRAVKALSKLAKLAGLTIDIKSFSGNYTASSVEPRDIPTDEEIVEVWKSLKNPAWQWIYGMLATFGLRGHEVFYLDLDNLLNGGNSIYVTESKTIPHHVWAFHPEWIELFNLRKVIYPNVTAKDHSEYSHRVTKYLGQVAKIPFTALDLRHAWAIRTISYGLPSDLAAKQMAHSLEVHERTYQRWIKPNLHQTFYELICEQRKNPTKPG